ncbi:hypothetical protein PR048_027331 [Dryococelus australis]|uniref:Uncharacterized protein n=1 Tax=Dryococelus australis TaxID=614101 RepID=A0ABQ9GF64_9NEOP|nr:hypothetical protein PR048_027331 [Dryococelus australis]
MVHAASAPPPLVPITIAGLQRHEACYLDARALNAIVKRHTGSFAISSESPSCSSRHSRTIRLSKEEQLASRSRKRVVRERPITSRVMIAVHARLDTSTLLRRRRGLTSSSNRFNPLPDFRMWESCRTMSAGFHGELPFAPPPFHSGAAPHSPRSPSSAFKTSIWDPATHAGSANSKVARSHIPERAHSGVVVGLLASHLCEPGSIPGEVACGFSHVEIMLDDAASGRVFSGISRFPHPCIQALLTITSLRPHRSLRVSLNAGALTHPDKRVAYLAGNLRHPYKRCMFIKNNSPYSDTQKQCSLFLKCNPVPVDEHFTIVCPNHMQCCRKGSDFTCTWWPMEKRRQLDYMHPAVSNKRCINENIRICGRKKKQKLPKKYWAQKGHRTVHSVFEEHVATPDVGSWWHVCVQQVAYHQAVRTLQGLEGDFVNADTVTEVSAVQGHAPPPLFSETHNTNYANLIQAILDMLERIESRLETGQAPQAELPKSAEVVKPSVSGVESRNSFRAPHWQRISSWTSGNSSSSGRNSWKWTSDWNSPGVEAGRPLLADRALQLLNAASFLARSQSCDVLLCMVQFAQYNIRTETWHALLVGAIRHLGVHVGVARIAPQLLDLGRAAPYPSQ